MRELEKQMSLHPEDKALQTAYAQAQTNFEASDGYQVEVKIKKILNGMGFADKACDTNISTLSGGEKTRLAIAKPVSYTHLYKFTLSGTLRKLYLLGNELKSGKYAAKLYTVMRCNGIHHIACHD